MKFPYLEQSAKHLLEGIVVETLQVDLRCLLPHPLAMFGPCKDVGHLSETLANAYAVVQTLSVAAMAQITALIYSRGDLQ